MIGNNDIFYKELIMKVGEIKGALDAQSKSLECIKQKLDNLERRMDKSNGDSIVSDAKINNHEKRIVDIENSTGALAKEILKNPKSIAIFIGAIIVEVIVGIKSLCII